MREFSLSFTSKEKTNISLVPEKSVSRPTVGLVLSGGGIRGIAQVGVLKVLEEADIPIDLIVGTSIGGVVGGFYASGYSPEEIIQLARTIDWAAVLSDTPQRSSLFLGEKEKRGRAILQIRMHHFKPVVPEAYSPGQMLHRAFTESILNAHYHAMNFNNLKVPLKIIATDMISGKKIILDRGDLAQALRATVGIPLLFSPVEYGSYTLVDGGVVDNIPVSDARDSGADLVIAVDTTSPLRTAANINAPWEIADQITTIMQQEKDLAQLAAADIAISFDDLLIVSTNFEALEFLYHEGVQRTRAKLPIILQKLQEHRANASQQNSYKIDRITVVGADSLFLAPFINAQQRNWSDIDIQHTMDKIFSSGSINDVRARIRRFGNEQLLEFDIRFNVPLNSITFYGNSQFRSDSLLEPFRNMLHKPINQANVQNAVEQILQKYRKHGFSLAKVDKINFNEHDSSAHIYIFEGFVKDVHISGLQKTREFVISREFDIRRGELFRFERAQKSLDNILATDLFSTVNLSITSESIYHTVHLHFKEKPSHVIRIGGRYDTERTAKVFTEFSDENLFGSGNDLTFHLQYGGRDFRSSIDYRADRIFKSYLTSRYNLHHYESDHFAYSDLKLTGEYQRRVTGLNIELGRQIGRFGTLSGHLRSEKIDIFRIDGFGYDTGSMSFSTLGMKTVIDTRDEVPFPINGKHHIFFYEISSGQVYGDEASFYKVMNQLTTVTTFFKRHTFRPKLLWGTSGAGTPFSEQFRLGGQDSFYGLHQDQLRGKHMVLASMDYRFMIPDLWLFDTFLAARYDLGAMWAKMEQIKATDFLGGYGAEIAFKTPIGPISFAYGQTNRGQRQFYFSAGFDF